MLKMGRQLKKLFSIILLVVLIFGSFSIFPNTLQATTDIYTRASGTVAGYAEWTVPAGVTTADFACWGGGGGGADGSNAGGGGGGGGAFASSTISVTVGSIYRIFVADSVLEGVTNASSTASSSVPAVIVNAQGGRGAGTGTTGAAGGLAASSVGTTKKNGGDGGAGESGTGDEGGGGGGAGGLTAVGAVGQDQQTTIGGAGGQGDGTNGGTGGAGGDDDGAGGNGVNGTDDADGGGGGGGGDDGDGGGNGGIPGGGGGGGDNCAAGECNGASGQCMITYSVTIPTVSTDSASAGVSSASLTGTISAVGSGGNATARGFAWGLSSTLSNGTVATTSETAGGPFGTGAFSHTISTLMTGKTYYYRAYATNPSGTGYAPSILNFTAGTDTSTSRTLRLFEGFRIIVMEGGRIILNQQ